MNKYWEGTYVISITLPVSFFFMLCPEICSHSHCHCITWIILRWFHWNVVHVFYCGCLIYYHLLHIVVRNHNVISAIHFFIYVKSITSWIHCVLAHFINVKQNTFSVTAPNACFHSYQLLGMFSFDKIFTIFIIESITSGDLNQYQEIFRSWDNNASISSPKVNLNMGQIHPKNL